MQESIRGCDVFLIQPTCPPVNDSLMELMVMIDACKRASARSITAVVPYYGYARADRKTHGRECVAAKLHADPLLIPCKLPSVGYAARLTKLSLLVRSSTFWAPVYWLRRGPPMDCT